MHRTDTLDLAHVVTRPFKTTIENDDGTRTYVDVYSYLDQLQDAITGKSRGSGGNQTSAPLSTNALDLWREIAETTLEYWPGYGRPHLARTPLHRRIQQWASVALNSNDDQDKEVLHKHLARWIREIQGLFEPSVELSAPCPECHESYVWRHEAGENIRKRCLTFNQHRATCINCKTTWEGKASMANLARILNNDQPLNGTPAHTTQTGE